jgi:RNA polymerase sigma-54 factor
MRLEYTQDLKLEQRLQQSPQMIQAMQILQLTTPELLDRIEAELQENPFLETATADAAEDDGDPEPRTAAEPAETVESAESSDLDDFARLDNLLESAPWRPPARTREDGSDALQDLAAPELDNAEDALAELRMRDADPELVRNAELILAFLDERGFLPDGLEEVAELTGVRIEELTAALRELRTLVHPAVGAPNLRECFLLQWQALPDADPLARTILEKHFDELLANRLPQIAKAEGVGLEEVRHAIEVLSLFDSRPLRTPGAAEVRALFPDVVIEEGPTGDFEVRLVRDGLPEVRLTRKAHEILDHAKDDKRLHEFLLRKIERARWFLDAVQQRRETLLKIARVLARRQEDFLRWGPERLAPLRMQEVADEVHVHISTVSRAIRGKSAQTPQGILTLKSFFSGGQRTARGGTRSRVAIQERIKEIVQAEDPAHPLSDEEIVRILRDRDGTRVARRTVTKYRIELGIPSSPLRRAY